MKSLNDFTDAEQKTVLKFVQILQGEMRKEKAPAAVMFSTTMSEDESEQQAGEQARELANRRNAGHGGRFLVDTTDEDKEIRAGIKDWMRRTKRDKYYKTD